ncbi:MAG: hypothetical protein CVU43_00740 [Chloroflexi bacterium HGW-Chloroflexi-5]|jgi:hypothetical protein|nr:MAG: hypothetical protein CVU43_00740 [Chloroflexi bacterium HGW-Chloroflexi-5]
MANQDKGFVQSLSYSSPSNRYQENAFNEFFSKSKNFGIRHSNRHFFYREIFVCQQTALVYLLASINWNKKEK